MFRLRVSNNEIELFWFRWFWFLGGGSAINILQIVHKIYFEERAVTVSVHTTKASVHNFHVSDGIWVELPHNGSPEEPIRIHRNEGWWIRCVWKYCCLLGSVYDCRHRQCFAPNDERVPILSVEYVASATPPSTKGVAAATGW